jgi:hypothetical protein
MTTRGRASQEVWLSPQSELGRVAFEATTMRLIVSPTNLAVPRAVTHQAFPESTPACERFRQVPRSTERVRFALGARVVLHELASYFPR